jgi:hypothetical protein
MKKIQTFAVGLLALALASTASAQTYIRITGAQGLRGAVHQGIVDILKPGYTVGYAGTSLSTAMQAVFTGTTATGNYPVIIKTSYGTSTNGVRTVAKNLPVTTWLQDGLTGSGLGSGPYESGTTADVTVSGEFQSTTRFPTPVLTDQIIGVFPYVWVRNAGSPSTLSNINSTLAQALLPAGQTTLSMFTGLADDGATLVTLIGRDEGASSRETLFAESGFGIYNSPYQYKLSGTTSVTGAVAYPAATVDGVSYPAGHSGYGSFSTLVAALNLPNSLATTGGWVIGYSDIVDAVVVNPGTVATATASLTSSTVSSIAVTNGGTNYNSNPIITISGGGGTGATAVATVSAAGVITGITVTNGGSGYTSTPTVAVTGGALMSWNGVSYSTTAVEQGQYTYWSYAHFLYRTSFSGVAKTVSDQLAKQIHDVDIVVGGNSLIKNMAVGRSGDGDPVTPGNPY